jgi:hypothetical protein
LNHQTGFKKKRLPQLLLLIIRKVRKFLEVKIKDSGEVYHYFDVSEDVCEEYKEEIRLNKSSGEFYSKRIKPFYEYEKIDE